MKAVQDIIDFLAAFNWPLILAFIGSGPFLSGLGQFIKKNRKLESSGVIQSMMWALSSVHTLILLWLANQPALLPMLGIYAPAMYAYTQAWYPVIKRIDEGISQFKAGLDAQNAQVTAALNNAVTNPTPMTSLPGQTTEQPTETPVW